MIRYGIVGVGGFAANWVRWLEGLEAAGAARLAAAVVRDRNKYAAEVERLAAGAQRVTRCWGSRHAAASRKGYGQPCQTPARACYAA